MKNQKKCYNFRRKVVIYMLGVYVFVGICILGVIIFTIWIVKVLLVPQIKMQKAVAGERTKFIVDTSDKGYEYYEKFVNEWMRYNNFPKYSRKIRGSILKYYVSDLIFKFGFNYYKDNQYLVIEVWLSVLGNENPLSFKSYTHNEGTVDLASGITTGNLKSDGKVSIAVNQQGKDEYLEFLSSLINIPEIVQDTNNVTLKEKYDLSKIKNQSIEKTKNHKTILIILAISLFLTAIIFLLGLV